MLTVAEFRALQAAIREIVVRIPIHARLARCTGGQERGDGLRITNPALEFDFDRHGLS